MVAALAMLGVGAGCGYRPAGQVLPDPALAQILQQPVRESELNPPPSLVEVRARCWRRYEPDASLDIDEREMLVRKCVADYRNARPER